MTERMKLSDAEIRDIEEGLPIRQFMSDDAKMGLCPYCHMQTFYYNDTHYLCSSCNASGNVIAYLICNHGMTFPAAVYYCQELLKKSFIKVLGIKEANE